MGHYAENEGELFQDFFLTITKVNNTLIFILVIVFQASGVEQFFLLL